jgi:hypothetical protein
MLDLWNGLFGLVAAIVGGVATAAFMLVQQKRDFRRHADEALRACLSNWRTTTFLFSM